MAARKNLSIQKSLSKSLRTSLTTVNKILSKIYNLKKLKKHNVYQLFPGKVYLLSKTKTKKCSNLVTSMQRKLQQAIYDSRRVRLSGYL